ncbi:MAG: EAL domain-containing protein [Ideonella sp.]
MNSLSLSSCWRELARRWRQEFHVYRSPDSDAAQIRGRHMQSMGRLTPLLMFGNLAGGALLAMSLRSTVSPWALLPWLAAILLACAAGANNWWVHYQQPRATASPRAISRTIRGASAFALLWAGACFAWLPQIPQVQQMLLATLVIGMMCGGAFALASVPQAACSYLLIITIGSMSALVRAGGAEHFNLVLMTLLYGLLLCMCVLTTARIYTARLISEREAERQSELVGLLLRDFEEHSADLLWEVGPDARFTRVSARLVEALSTTEGRLRRCGLVETMLRHLPLDEPDACVNRLAAKIAAGRPYRDLTLPVQTANGARWWSVTAKPLLDATGQIEGWRGVVADVTQARQSHAKLEQQAHSDSLTGLANRLQLHEHLMRAIDEVQYLPESSCAFALICLDIDHFKAINDALGHSMGDAVLIEVARRLKGSLRESDLVARVGGDEFAVVIDLVDGVEQAMSMARRLVSVLAKPFDCLGHVVPLGVSAGMALAPAHGNCLDELLVNADLALYDAKERGRGRCELFAPEIGERHRRRINIAQQLRGALERDEFALAWQPQVHIDSWRLAGAEVLLRWQHPMLGNVSPVEFISLAEESGQINAIGAWVLEQACLGGAQLPDSIAVSVNASTAQLMQDDFIDVVRRALARSGLPARRLKIEITESLFMDASPVALSNLHGLRELGVSISLDDFGTGFSSLAYLLRFPFDVLKIDRAFVLEIMARDDARALVKSIVDMAASLGMGTVAEGVEDNEQLDVLRQAGCEQIQGYLVAKPMKLAQLQQMMRDWKDRPLRPTVPWHPQAVSLAA